MRLTQSQTLDLYATLTLRVKNEQTRGVIFLMASRGWQFCRDKLRRFVYYLINPLWCGQFMLKVSREVAANLLNHWVERESESNRLVYYRLRPGRV